MEKTIHNALRIGIDIGGTAIKYGVVDTATGILVSPIAQQRTPQPATPTAIANTLRAVMTEIRSWESTPSPLTAAGVAFPAIIRQGTACSAANISDEWIGLDVELLLSTALQRPAKVLNDADAAGLAESSHGAGKGQRGMVLVLTLGTGIGSALVVDGNLVPNLELGHLQLNGLKAETTTSALAREKEGLSWNEYSSRLQQYLSHAEFLFSPDLIIIGGGISVRHEEFLPQIRLTTPIVPAHLHNSAGVIGAAQIAG